MCLAVYVLSIHRVKFILITFKFLCLQNLIFLLFIDRMSLNNPNLRVHREGYYTKCVLSGIFMTAGSVPKPDFI